MRGHTKFDSEGGLAPKAPPVACNSPLIGDERSHVQIWHDVTSVMTDLVNKCN